MRGDLTAIAQIGVSAAEVRECCGAWLAEACAGGHLEVARTLVATFSITAAEVRANNNYVLAMAFHNNRLEAAKFIVSCFDLAAADILEASRPRPSWCVSASVAPAMHEWVYETCGLEESE